MAFQYTEEESMLGDAVSRFADEVLEVQLPSFLEQHRFPTELVREFAEMGFMGAAYSPAYGGAGLGARGAAIIAERLARVEPSFAAIFLCNSAPCSLIDKYGNDEQKKEWLQPVNEGRFIGSFGVTEAHGGSDVANIKTTAKRDGDDYVINGAKLFSTNAGTPLHGFS